MPTPTLVGLAYSPWTQRARWALDHHGVGYRFRHYVPIVGEPLLRLQAGKLTGRISVPVLFTAHGAIIDSIAIARHADSLGSGSKLYDGHEAAVARATELAEPALDAARVLVLRAIDASPAAQEESVSLPVPRALKRPAARLGTMFLARKWRAQLSEAEAEGRVVRALEQLREALSGRDYIDQEFSLADMVMSGVVQTIKPAADKYIRLLPATRVAWTRTTLAARFGDLVGWRDVLFDKHFKRGKA